MAADKALGSVYNETPGTSSIIWSNDIPSVAMTTQDYGLLTVLQHLADGLHLLSDLYLPFQVDVTEIDHAQLIRANAVHRALMIR